MNYSIEQIKSLKDDEFIEISKVNNEKIQTLVPLIQLKDEYENELFTKIKTFLTSPNLQVNGSDLLEISVSLEYIKNSLQMKLFNQLSDEIEFYLKLNYNYQANDLKNMILDEFDGSEDDSEGDSDDDPENDDSDGDSGYETE